MRQPDPQSSVGARRCDNSSVFPGSVSNSPALRLTTPPTLTRPAWIHCLARVLGVSGYRCRTQSSSFFSTEAVSMNPACRGMGGGQMGSVPNGRIYPAQGECCCRVNAALQATLLDPGQALLPDSVEQHGGFDIAQTIFGDLPKASLRQKAVDVPAGDPLALGRFDPEGFAIEIQIEPPRGAVAATHAVEGQLLGQVAMRFGLVTIAQPIFARDR